MSSKFGRAVVDATMFNRNDTQALRLRGSNPKEELRPAIVLHGWSGDKDAPTTLLGQLYGENPPFGHRAIDVLCATGRTVYIPFTGSNFGTYSTYPGFNGTGLQAITDMQEQGLIDGLNGETIDIMGTSGGGLSAINWCSRFPELLHRLFLVSPGFDIEFAYDNDAIAVGWGLPPISPTMRALVNANTKAEWYAAIEEYDPLRNITSAQVFGDRTLIFSAINDEIVPWDGLVDYAADIGATLIAGSNGGHITYSNSPEWDDLYAYRHFEEFYDSIGV